MNITFVVPDLARPIVGVAARMARYLVGSHQVEIVGTRLWGGVEPAYAEEFAYRPVDLPRIYRFPEYWRDVRRLADAVTGDVVIAMKAYAPAIPAALLAKKRTGCKVISYQDEWDSAYAHTWSFVERLANIRRDWMHPCDALYVPHVERMLSRCDLRLCTTSFLAKKFNARIYHVGIDCDFFKPQPAQDTARLREELGLTGKFTMVFGGMLRPHKGLEPFAEALARTFGDAARLVILSPMDSYLQSMMHHPVYGRNIVCPVPDSAANLAIHQRMPLYLSVADVLAVPLSNDILAQSQMPIKTFDAMAMAKPILASAVADVPAVLEGCGWLTPPGDVDALSAAMKYIAEHPAEAAARGAAAREKCLRDYSAVHGRDTLLSLLRELRP